MRKTRYVSPELEVIRFMTEDVITVSGGEGTEPTMPEETEQPALPWD